jgi:hypothetical protein
MAKPPPSAGRYGRVVEKPDHMPPALAEAAIGKNLAHHPGLSLQKKITVSYSWRASRHWRQGFRDQQQGLDVPSPTSDASLR